VIFVKRPAFIVNPGPILGMEAPLNIIIIIKKDNSSDIYLKRAFVWLRSISSALRNGGMAWGIGLV